MSQETHPVRLSADVACQAPQKARERFTQARRRHWDAVAEREDRHRGLGAHYRRMLAARYRHLVGKAGRVLEVGCARGDLLAALEPIAGVGVDFSSEMLARARAAHPKLELVLADAHDLSGLGGQFDTIILSDLVNDLWDVQRVLEQLAPLCTPRTRVILNSYSRLWEAPLTLASRLGLSRPNLPQNWLARNDLSNLLRLAGFELVRSWPEILLPLPIPLLAPLANRWLARLWPFRHLALTNFFVARPAPRPRPTPLVSVVVPARNEAGNIEAILARTPELGRGTELVFVEGHSTDGTWEAIRRGIAAHPERRCLALQQAGRGKGDAVRLGFAHASGDLLMILDADLTVPPEDLPRFVEVAVSGRGEYINGVRLVYPMEERAMRFANLLGNKFFSFAFSWLLGQSIKDTLCGTKVLWREDYERIAANRAYFGDFDPFGDFDLIFGAARLSLAFVDVPIRYRERTYGTTNIQRWRHGWILLRMLAFASRRLKFV
ncbi:MAG: glycosyltransferase [Thermoanaerobaculaceae bacterium]